MAEARSVDYMVNAVLGDPATKARLVQDPDDVLRTAAAQAKVAIPILGDKMVYRMVVGFLGGVVVIVAVGLIVLAYAGRTGTPEGLIALGSAAVGALAGLLAPAPSR
ncbi:hypothetical protein [Methylobacterium sp. J-068]|uniref:hypothetical protein n=1 Tax=Methylobacterium sp. J-068 TaxID=2836649 RepID=UPI001FB9B43A|nr:hypothetical protein [Methylobacterium sp. J-068]MCJ2034830.1 hypothetical protein [Methylobacterium sp. J-068]